MTDATVEGGLDEPTELEPDPGSLALAAPEDTGGRAEWEAAAAAVLRKARRLSEDDADSLVWEKLTRTTLDGVGITPLGTPGLLGELSTAGRPTRTTDWDIRPHLSVTDAKSAHEEAITDLENGATSLWLRVAPDTDLVTLLQGVFLDLAPVVLDCPDDAVATARAFLEYAEDTDLHPATNLGIDAAEVSAGSLNGAEAAELAARAGVLGFVVDATVVHDQGASDGQELAYAMQVGAAYLRALTAAGLDVDAAAALVEFRFAATDEQFPTIAKLRAARRLWARVLELSGGSVTGMRQHVVTSRPMMSSYDPWVNMLRTTVAAFAAGVGGADSVTVLPFDSPLGRPDALGRRVARNTSSLLISESHLAKVADPAGGSYAVEKLTDDLAVAAWDLFGRLDEGEDLAPLIEATVAVRDQQVATRKRPLTGLTEFPNLGETLPVREPDPLAPHVRAYGADFEALRDSPAAAHVFLATLGTVAAHTARATFAANLLAAGGVAVDVAGPTQSAEDLLAAYAGQNVVCLAGSDGAYEGWGQEAAAALREAGAEWVVIAGKPTDYTDDSCAMGVDALDFLTRTREKLA
ncbi:methylmalonyl-CoA mutase family protein [Nocardioides sp.]|uniref:methylmalonyl-CoA mutase family protein n=1 Tax=Nocardioides sp. TaxID=35761 RepID=UPI003567AD23